MPGVTHRELYGVRGVGPRRHGTGQYKQMKTVFFSEKDLVPLKTF